VFICLSGESFVKEQLVEIADEHSEEGKENQAMSDVRLF
jgi:hypothetical protein